MAESKIVFVSITSLDAFSSQRKKVKMMLLWIMQTVEIVPSDVLNLCVWGEIHAHETSRYEAVLKETWQIQHSRIAHVHKRSEDEVIIKFHKS